MTEEIENRVARLHAVAKFLQSYFVEIEVDVTTDGWSAKSHENFNKVMRSFAKLLLLANGIQQLLATQKAKAPPLFNECNDIIFKIIPGIIARIETLPDIDL